MQISLIRLRSGLGGGAFEKLDFPVCGYSTLVPSPSITIVYSRTAALCVKADADATAQRSANNEDNEAADAKNYTNVLDWFSEVAGN